MTDIVDQDLASLGSAVEADKAAAAQKELGGDKPDENPNSFGRWIKNLPSNISVGLIDASLNTLDMMDSIQSEEQQAASEKTPQQKRMAPSDAAPMLNAAVALGQGLEQGEFEPRQALRLFRNFFAQGADGKGSSTSDAITQSAAQFMIPFMGFNKAFAGFKAAQNAPKVVQLGGKVAQAASAETATLASAFDPHGGRLADLVEFGKHTEGKLADTLNTMAPDGSAINAYIDYMTDRVNESDAEGRFKNVIDGLAGSAAVAGLLKTGAKTIRVARMGLEHVVPSGAGSAIPNQEGMVAFHGTPHDFGAFDISKVGTGEGQQVYGHGIYLAEEKEVAKHYVQAGGPYLSVAGRRMHAEEMDGLPVLGPVKDLLLEAQKKGLAPEGARLFAEREIRRNAAQWGIKNQKEQFYALDLVRQTKAEKGNLVTGEIPDDAIAKMLDHDKPISQQPRFKELQDEIAALYAKRVEPTSQHPLMIPVADVASRSAPGALLYDALADALGGQDKASKWLLDRGVPGIRYLDAGSRAKAGEGTRNIVLFDDKLVTVTKKE